MPAGARAMNPAAATNSSVTCSLVVRQRLHVVAEAFLDAAAALRAGALPEADLGAPLRQIANRRRQRRAVDDDQRAHHLGLLKREPRGVPRARRLADHVQPRDVLGFQERIDVLHLASRGVDAAHVLAHAVALTIRRQHAVARREAGDDRRPGVGARRAARPRAMDQQHDVGAGAGFVEARARAVDGDELRLLPADRCVGGGHAPCAMTREGAGRRGEWRRWHCGHVLP